MKAFFDEAVKPMVQIFEQFPFEQARPYGCMLAQTYFYVRHSTRLLARSASRFNSDLEPLHVRFGQHMAEEKSHHLLAEHDIRGLGLSLSEFPELPSTKSFYECQYYKSTDLDPTLLFGYILALEGIMVISGKQVYQRAVDSHGHKAVSFLKVHAEEDIGHLDSALKVISSLTPAQQEGIKSNFNQTVFLFTQMLCQAKAA